MKAALILFFIFLPASSFGRDVTWTGASGNHQWEDPNNWDVGVPCDECDVFITNDSVSVSSAVVVKSLSISDAALNILSEASLVSIGSSSTGLQISSDSKIHNNGLVQIKESMGRSIIITSSSFFNESQGSSLFVSDSDNSGVTLSIGGLLNNKGLINVEGVMNYGLEIGSLFGPSLSRLENEGTIYVSKSGLRDFSISEFGVFDNKIGGVTECSTSGNESFYSLGAIFNNGLLEVKLSLKDGINTKSLVNNGTIRIENVADHGFISSSFTNNGTMEFRNISGIALNTYGSSTNTIMNFGDILVEDSYRGIFYGNNGTFFNESSGNIILKDLDSGIDVRSTFVNKGTIKMYEISGRGLLLNTSSGFFENEGELTIKEASTAISINYSSQLSFRNNPCGLVQVNDTLKILRDILNEGLFVYNNRAPIVISNSAVLQNSGVFVDILNTERPGGALSGVGTYVKGFDGPMSYGVREKNLVSQGSSPNYSISYNWFLESNKLTLAGVYDSGGAYFLPFQEAVNTDTLFFEVSHDGIGCSRQAGIPVNESINCDGFITTAIFEETLSTDWHTPENWDSGSVPNSCTIAIIPSNKKCTITTNRKARAYRIQGETGSVFDAELGVVLEVAN